MAGQSPGGWRILGLPSALLAIGAGYGAYHWHEPTGYVFSAIFGVAAIWFILRKKDT